MINKELTAKIDEYIQVTKDLKDIIDQWHGGKIFVLWMYTTVIAHLALVIAILAVIKR